MVGVKRIELLPKLSESCVQSTTPNSNKLVELKRVALLSKRCQRLVLLLNDSPDSEGSALRLDSLYS